MPLVYMFKPSLIPMLDEQGQEVLSGGVPKLRVPNIAGELQTLIEGIAPCEHGGLEQLRAEGHFRHQTRPETEDEMYARYAGGQGVGEDIVRALVSGGFLTAPQPQQVYTSEIRVTDPAQIEIITTSALGGLSLSDFPESFSFGNGVTTGNTIKLRDGGLQTIGWIVFPDSVAATVRTRANRTALNAICQPPAGGAIQVPTRIPEPSPKRIRECRHWFLKYPPIIGKARFCVKCGAARFGEHTVQLGANTITLGDAAGDPSSAGEIQRNGANLRFHDGSAVQDLVGGGGGAVIREGGNATEVTTTSTTEVDLTDVTGLNIAATTPFLIIGSARKTSGAAVSLYLGLDLNTTTVRSLNGVGTTSNFLESGPFIWEINARVTNYLRAGK